VFQRREAGVDEQLSLGGVIFDQNASTRANQIDRGMAPNAAA